jgi:DNA repair exonuclease SbcCD ATPase subunit
MAKQIKANDLFENEDIFRGIRESAEKTIVTIDKLNAEFKQTAEGLKNSIGNADLGSTKGINDFTKATTQANQLQKEAAELAKMRAEAEKQAAIAQREQAKAQEQAIKTALAEAKAKDQAAKAAEKVAKAAQNEASSYKQLEKNTRELKNQSKELAASMLQLEKSGQQNTAAYAKLEEQYREVTKAAKDGDHALKGIDKTVGDNFRNVGNYEGATKSLKLELRQLTQALQQMEQTDPRFAEMAQRAGDLKDQIGDTQAVIKATGGTAVETLSKGLSGVGQIGIAAFQGVESSMALMGVESEAVMETMMRLQALAGLGDALETLGGLGDKLTEIRAAFAATAAKLGLFTTAKAVDTTVTVGQTVATEGATVATSGLGKAMKALPIVAIIAGIAALAAAVYAYYSSQKELSASQQAFNDTLDTYSQAQAGAIKITMEVGNAFAMAKKGVISKEEALKKYNDTLGDSFGRATNLNEAEKLFRSKTKAYIESVGLRAQADELFRRAAEASADAKQREIETEDDIANIRKGIGAYKFKKDQIALIREETEKIRDKSKVYEDEASKLLERAMVIEKDNKVVAESNQVEEKAVKVTKEKNKEVKLNIELLQNIAHYTNEANKATFEWYQSQKLAVDVDQMEAINQAIKERALITADIAVLEAEMALTRANEAGDTEAIAKAQKELTAAKIKAIEEQKKLDLEANADSGNSGAKRALIEKQAEADILAAQNEFAAEYIDKEKQMFEESAKMAEQTANYFIEQSDKKISQIDKEMQAAEKQFDTLQELANNGNINAKESLAEQQRIINEANQRKEKELRRQQRIKLAESVYSTYAAKVASGSKNPLQETITETALLQTFIGSLPTFESGIEDTGSNGRGLDGKGGFLSVLHPNERVMPKSLNEQIGAMSNEALAKIAMEYQAGKLVSGHKGAESIQLAVLVNEMRDLKHVIQNKPETNIELGEITQSVMEIVKSTKTGNTKTYNRFKVRK